MSLETVLSEIRVPTAPDKCPAPTRNRDHGRPTSANRDDTHTKNQILHNTPQEHPLAHRSARHLNRENAHLLVRLFVPTPTLQGDLCPAQVHRPPDRLPAYLPTFFRACPQPVRRSRADGRSHARPRKHPSPIPLQLKIALAVFQSCTCNFSPSKKKLQCNMLFSPGFLHFLQKTALQFFFVA